MLKYYSPDMLFNSGRATLLKLLKGEEERVIYKSSFIKFGDSHEKGFKYKPIIILMT